MAHADRLQNLLAGATELPQGQRDAYLDAACAGDPVLRAEIDSLLKAHDEAGRFLADPTMAAAPAWSSAGAVSSGEPAAGKAYPGPLDEGPGTRIGPYKLLQLIGEGGFGSVFMAEQERPVQRKVALKIIKLGMDTRQVVARFEQERQALAIMDHPNIARVLDAGATDTGRPFFVMELVKGDPIVDYCDKNILGIRGRLELFAQVCAAVQHAHTKGIIHRDIKPSNILVATSDGRPSTKVIDFGIAKATAGKLTEKTLFTEHRALIGTPTYMSPEQAEGSLDIDTRTDVYSLGVLLYELLTGTTPFTSQELRSAAYGEMQRIIREVEPPKPSTRLSMQTDTIASVAAHRQTEPKQLGTMVRGELDWIVMRALEKDRQRRYETASGLAADIVRYLSGEAVSAAPPGTVYRFRKFIQRHRVAVSTGTAVAAALFIGLVAFAWQAKVARDQRDLAVAARQAEAEQRQQAETARAEAHRQELEAKRQAATADAVARFQTDMMAAADPSRQLGDKVTVVQVMSAAIKELDDGKLKDQPLVEAAVRVMIGKTFDGLGRSDSAEPALRRGLEIRRKELPPTDLSIASAASTLGAMLFMNNRLAEAEPLFRESLEIRRKVSPVNDPDIAQSISDLALVMLNQNKRAEAEKLFRESLAIQRATLPLDETGIANTLVNLAGMLQQQNQTVEAEQMLREAIAIQRKVLAPGNPELAFGITRLAILLQAQGKLSDAETLFREALDIRKKALPDGHPGIAYSLNTLAGILQDQNKLAEAEPLYRQSLAMRRASLPPNHPNISASLNDLSSLLRDMRKPAEAEAMVREALKISRAARPAGHPDIAAALTNLGLALTDQKKMAEAEPAFREALQIWTKSYPPGHPRIASGLLNVASVLEAQQKYAEAEEPLRELLATDRQLLPQGHSRRREGLLRLASVLRHEHKHDEAVAAYREVLSASDREPGPATAATQKVAAALAETLDVLNRRDEADAVRAKYQTDADRARTTTAPATRP